MKRVQVVNRTQAWLHLERRECGPVDIIIEPVKYPFNELEMCLKIKKTRLHGIEIKPKEWLIFKLEQ